jgi:hypothetical protein
MNGHTPDFDELVGGDLSPDERDRLRRVHELLVEAGPPPELTPRLQSPPAPPRATVIALPRRRRGALLLVAATVAIALFGGGWFLGSRGHTAHVARTVDMHGPGGAAASLVVYSVDHAGNWPMKMTVSGLAVLPHGQTYTLWLTKKGKLEASCGTFTVADGTTTVRLNAPYRLTEYDGWIVARSGQSAPLLTT